MEFVRSARPGRGQAFPGELGTVAEIVVQLHEGGRRRNSALVGGGDSETKHAHLGRLVFQILPFGKRKQQRAGGLVHALADDYLALAVFLQ
ncbi:hypothetical protein D3C86_1734280 [compost metagenome]